MVVTVKYLGVFLLSAVDVHCFCLLVTSFSFSLFLHCIVSSFVFQKLVELKNAPFEPGFLKLW